MIRVLHIFGKMNRGGAELRTLEVLPLLRDAGIQMDFCALQAGPGTLDDHIRELGSSVISCPMTLNRLSFASRFIRLLQKSRYDIVHSHVHLSSGWILRAADKAGVPGRIIHFRNTGDGRPVSFLRRCYSHTMRRMADRHANAVLAVSEGAMSSVWGHDWRNDPRAKVIYNGIDPKRFQMSPDSGHRVRQELGLGTDAPIVLQVGRLVAAKGHDTLIDAAPAVLSQHPDTHFLLAGEGERRAEIQARIRSVGAEGHVRLLGERDDIPRLMAAATCTVLPSRWEGLPGVVLESIATGTPVVASRLPGVVEIAAHSPLIHTVPIGDSAAFARGICHTIAATASKPPFPHLFTIDHCASAFLEVYRRIATPKHLSTKQGN